MDDIFYKLNYLEIEIPLKEVDKSNKSKHLPFKKKLEEYMERLEETKLKWNSYLLDKEFHRYVKKSTYTNELIYTLEKKYNLKDITISWINLYELLFRFQHYFNFLENDNIVFNIDLPGNEINATHFFYKKRNIKKIKWMAIQHHDNRIEEYDSLYLYRNNIDKWIIHDDYFTGSEIKNSSSKSSDISNYKAKYIYKKLKVLKSRLKTTCKLFISNISLSDNDILDDYVQYIIALSIINNGSSVIIKSNNIHIPFKLWMISVFSRYFEKIFLIKPESSIMYNSDVYIIGINYNGISKNDLDKLYHVLYSFKKSYIYKNLTEVHIDVIQIIYKLILELIDMEINYKKDSINNFNKIENFEFLYSQLELKTESIINKFILDYEINYI